ncbi:MAG: ORF6N domain-containing protein [Betaproteobacteria bacterium]|nr:ORF6N domain-containing protein [Betaproteobacteria bacterium]MCL2885185.1 ORF6N domain-containing protein [Betaproteobacteria bacterium]
MDKDVLPAAVESIALSIASVRNQRILLDSDLARLYGVETKRLNEQVRRNGARFPDDFMFQLDAVEYVALRSQNATLKTGRGQHRKYMPYAFTEHGAVMAAMVLNSPRAVEVSVYVVRAFVRLRELAATHQDLAKRLDDLEEKTESLALQHNALAQNTRTQLKQVLETIRQLMAPPETAKRPIGFITSQEKPGKKQEYGNEIGARPPLSAP